MILNLLLTLNFALGIDCPEYVIDAVELSDFMLKTAAEKVVLRCLSADYDGNGSLDFTVIHDLSTQKTPESQGAVYLFNKKNLIKQYPLGQAGEFSQYDPGERSQSCVKGKRVGIQLRNGQSNRVLLWNSKSKAFEQRDCP